MREIVYNTNNILLDEGLFFAKSIFETILWADRPMFLDMHMERLEKSLKILEMEPLEKNELLSFLEKLKIKNKAVKIVVTPLNIIITDREIPYKDKDYKKGFSMTFSKVIRNSTSRFTYIKSTAYIENIIEKKNAVKRGFNDVIFLNEKGFITETSCANIFIVKDNVIFTPKEKDGLLSGIIRRWIIENHNIIEKSITADELKNADEVFITNSLVGTMKINSIDDIIYDKTEVYGLIKQNFEKARRYYGGLV